MNLRRASTRCGSRKRAIQARWKRDRLRPAALLAPGLLVVAVTFSGCAGSTSETKTNFNPDPPALAVATDSLSTATVGSAYSATLQATGGTAPYTWSLSTGTLPAGLGLAASTGVISGVPMSPASSSFTVKATDSANNVAAKQLAISVAAANPHSALTVTTASLTAATVGSNYSATLQATGGTAPYTWSLSTGALPGGLGLAASTGVISGVPTSVASSFFTVKATDSANNAAVKQLSISVAASTPEGLNITGSILASATNGAAYTSTDHAVGGTLPYTWSVSSGQLPPGLTVTGTTGTISGTPTVNGAFNFTLKVADSSSTAQSASASYTITVSANMFDQYGGLTTMPSPNPSTGVFRTEKFGNKWMFVDPANNGFFLIGMYVFNEDQSVDNFGSSYYVRTAAKYGDNGPTWATAQLQRIQSWGFNASGPFASAYMLPTTVQNTWLTPDHTNPVKAPFIYMARPAYYGMVNQNNLSPQPIKNMFFGVSPYYPGYNPGNGVADYYDSNLQTFFTNQLTTDPSFVAIKSSPYKQYMIGMSVDDGDQMYGFGNGPDFVTGRNNAHLGWVVLTMSPIQTANKAKGFVYPDITVYSKEALHDQLVTEYGTIAALNTAWGSGYTTFDSSGNVVSGEGIANGDGSTAAFTKTLANPAVSAFSLQIFIAGQPVGGDTGKGAIWGPNLNGTINYSTGALSLTFSAGHAPASGTAITANYMQNGWGIGSGLMDEDGRPAHRAWVGIDYTFMADVNANLKVDLDNYLFQIAAHYFSTCKTVVQTWMPGLLYLGPDSLGTWGAPSNRNVLKAAAQYIDVMAMGGRGTALTQPMLDFIYTYYGDKPFYIGEFRTANADSALFGYQDSGAFTTQQARGQNYLSTIITYATASYSTNGSRPYVGLIWWRYLDNWGEKLNRGLVSLMDNAYDGHESVTGSGGVGVRSVPCSPPMERYLCGGEQKNYGDVISSVTQANRQVIQAVQQ